MPLSPIETISHDNSERGDHLTSSSSCMSRISSFVDNEVPRGFTPASLSIIVPRDVVDDFAGTKASDDS